MYSCLNPNTTPTIRKYSHFIQIERKKSCSILYVCGMSLYLSLYLLHYSQKFKNKKYTRINVEGKSRIEREKRIKLPEHQLIDNLIRLLLSHLYSFLLILFLYFSCFFLLLEQKRFEYLCLSYI